MTGRLGASKTLTAWIALIGGSLGLHRFYLHGWRDPWGWAFPLPTLLGLYGVQRMRWLGQDDRLAWILIPLLGVTLSIAMLAAIVAGLTPDERWKLQHPGAPARASGWMAVIAVLLAVSMGAGVLIATIAFTAQRYFEAQTAAEP